jgi:hypothetical protein
VDFGEKLYPPLRHCQEILVSASLEVEGKTLWTDF